MAAAQGAEEHSYGGITKKVIKEGAGAAQLCGVNVIAIVHLDARVPSIEVPFASTRDSDPIRFAVGAERVAKGLEIGVATMCKGERAIIICEPHLVKGFPGAPPDCTVIFDVELIDVYRGDDEMHREGTNLLRGFFFVLFCFVVILSIRYQHGIENESERLRLEGI